MSAHAEVTRIQRELEGLYRKQSDCAKNEATIAEKVARARAALGRTSSPTTIKSKLGEIQRLEREMVAIAKKKSEIAKKIATANTKLHKAQQRVAAEQSREQRRALEALGRQQLELADFQRRRLTSLADALPVADTPTPPQYDAFVSHASEDKDEVVRPLASSLIEAGFKIWYDEMELTVGDSLRRSIDRGLSASRFGIVVLSPSFFAKNWPQYELDGLVTREMEGQKVILPLWHKVSKGEVIGYSPSLADKLALNTATHTVEEIVEQLTPVLRTGRSSTAPNSPP